MVLLEDIAKLCLREEVAGKINRQTMVVTILRMKQTIFEFHEMKNEGQKIQSID